MISKLLFIFLFIVPFASFSSIKEAGELFRSGRLDEALSYSDSAFKATNNNRYLLVSAAVLTQMKKFELAEITYEKVIKTESDSHNLKNTYLGLSKLYNSTDELNKALVSVDKALEFAGEGDKKLFYLLNSKADLLTLLERTDEAQEVLDSNNPQTTYENFNHLNTYTRLFIQKEDFNLALSKSTEAKTYLEDNLNNKRIWLLTRRKIFKYMGNVDSLEYYSDLRNEVELEMNSEKMVQTINQIRAENERDRAEERAEAAESEKRNTMIFLGLLLISVYLLISRIQKRIKNKRTKQLAREELKKLLGD